MGKLSIGFVVAPLFPAAIAALLVSLTQRDLETGFIVAGLCIVGGYLAALFIGAPLFVLWRRRGWLSLKALVVLGGISAFWLTLAARLLMGPGRNDTPWVVGLLNLLTLTLPVGVVAGAALWWIGIRGNTALTSASSRRPRLRCAPARPRLKLGVVPHEQRDLHVSAMRSGTPSRRAGAELQKARCGQCHAI